MVKVIFECKNIADLKLQIQEYSLAHLGMNLAQINELRKPFDPEAGSVPKADSSPAKESSSKPASGSFL